MKVTVKTSGDVTLYHQLLAESKTLNKLVAIAMETMPGDKFKIELENNGHVMSFSVENVDIEAIVRTANGVLMREKKDPALT